MAAAARGEDPVADFDFTRVKTFTVRPGTMKSKTAKVNGDRLEPLVRKHIAGRLAAAGLTETGGKGDLVVNFTLIVSAERERDRRANRRPSRLPLMRESIKGMLLIAIRSSKDGVLVWRKFPTFEEDDPRKFEERLPRHIARTLGKFPPEKKE